MIGGIKGLGKALLFLVLVANATSCEQPNTGGPPRRDVTAREFGKMRWLTGTWRGQIRSDEESDNPFYERWSAIDDSTLVMHRFGNKELTVPTDSVRVELRGGSVYYRAATHPMPLIGISSRSVIFFPEGEERGGVTFNTQVACADTLALATTPCYVGMDSTQVYTRFWWGALWHTAPLVLGRPARGGNQHLVYNPLWRSSILPRD